MSKKMSNSEILEYQAGRADAIKGFQPRSEEGAYFRGYSHEKQWEALFEGLTGRQEEKLNAGLD